MSILIIFVVGIIVLQIILFDKTGKLISNMKQVLSGKFKIESAVEDHTIVIRYIVAKKDKISENIETSINTYLRKNKGAVSDFNLIKDIVERNCDTLEAEITSQTPLPLYLGLMGTVTGIIIGLFTITITGGFSNIQNVIEILMTDVAIAMIASLVGIGCTTFSLWKSKQCKVTVEANKNHFYTWIQTHLLPVMSRSAVSAITLLQQNLTHFNESFTGTIDRLEEKLGDVGNMYDSQIEILQKIEAIDVKKMATANVKVLAALDGSMGSLDRFQNYMASVTEYLTAVRELNGKLDEHLERTETLSVVSEFYRNQMKEIGLRQDAIKSAVLSVDDVMKSAMATLQSNSEEGLRSMQEAFVAQMMTMQEMIARQTSELTSQINRMPQMVQKLDEISAIPSKLDKLIDRIEKSNAGLAKQISQSLHALSSTAVKTLPGDSESDNSNTGFNIGSNPWMKWIGIVSLVVIVIVSIANLSVNIISANSESAQTENALKASEPDTSEFENALPAISNDSDSYNSQMNSAGNAVPAEMNGTAIDTAAAPDSNTPQK